MSSLSVSDPKIWLVVLVVLVTGFLIGMFVQGLGAGTSVSEVQGFTHTALDAYGRVVRLLQEKNVTLQVEEVQSNPAPSWIKLRSVARFKSGATLDLDLAAGTAGDGSKPVYTLRFFAHLHESSLPANLKEQGLETRLAAMTMTKCANLQRTFSFGDPEQGAPVWPLIIQSMVVALNEYDVEFARIEPKIREANRLIIEAQEARVRQAQEHELNRNRLETELRTTLDKMWTPIPPVQNGTSPKPAAAPAPTSPIALVPKPSAQPT